MKKQNLALLLIFYSTFACTSIDDRDYSIYSTKRNLSNSLSLNEKQIAIKLVNDDITDYNTISFSSVIINDVGYLALYNDLYHSVDIYDLTNLMFWKRIELSSNMLSFWERSRNNPINSIFLYKFDSIFILTVQNLLISDTSGNVLFKYYINKDFYTNKKSKNIYIYRNNRDFPIYFDPLTKNIYLHQYNATASSYSRKYFESEIEAIVNLKDSAITTLPFIYPAFFNTGFYSRTGIPKRLVNGDLNIYTFELDPNIYIYNRKTHVNSIEGGQSKFQTHPARPFSAKKVNFDRDKEMKYLTTSFSYGNLLYDEYRKLYYRFFFREQPLKNNKGFFNTSLDRREVLMVFNEKFEVIDEIELQPYKYNCYFSFVTPSGFYISSHNPLNPETNSNELGFYIIDISIKK